MTMYQQPKCRNPKTGEPEMFQGSSYPPGASPTREIGAWLLAEVMHYLAMCGPVMNRCAEGLRPELVQPKTDVMHYLSHSSWRALDFFQIEDHQPG